MAGKSTNLRGAWCLTNIWDQDPKNHLEVCFHFNLANKCCFAVNLVIAKTSSGRKLRGQKVIYSPRRICSRLVTLQSFETKSSFPGCDPPRPWRVQRRRGGRGGQRPEAERHLGRSRGLHRQVLPQKQEQLQEGEHHRVHMTNVK